MKFSSFKIYQLIREKERKEKRKRMFSWGEGIVWLVVAGIFVSQVWKIFGPEESWTEPVTNYAFTFLYSKHEVSEEAINLDSIRNILDTLVDPADEIANSTEKMADLWAEATPQSPSESIKEPQAIGIPRRHRVHLRGGNSVTPKTEQQEENPVLMDSVMEETAIIEMRGPSFIGGTGALNQFIKQNLSYPFQAKENNIEGKVMLKLWIETDGKIAQIGIMESLGYGCDEEAVRIVRSMPSWLPGIKKGEKRAMWAYVPVIFSLTRYHETNTKAE